MLLASGFVWAPGWVPFLGCSDPRRFSEWRDPSRAVIQANTELVAEKPGLESSHQNAEYVQVMGAYDLPSESAVAGYIAAQMYWQRRWSHGLTFKDFLRLQARWRLQHSGPPFVPGPASGVRRSPNPYEGVGLAPLIPGQAFEALMSEPPSSCDGALLHDPSNRRLVQLMHGVVGDDQWLLREPL